MKVNHIHTYILYVFLGLGMLMSTSAQAQDTPTDWEETPTTGQGEIEDAQFVVVKDREIKLPVMSRPFRKVPPLPQERKSEDLTFSFLETEQKIEAAKPTIRPLKAKEATLDKLYANYLRAWFGTYGGHGIDLFLHNKRNKYAAYGLGIQHHGFLRGPVDGGNSEENASTIEGKARFFTKYAEMGAFARYERNRISYYGYSPTLSFEDSDSLRQIWNYITLGGHVAGNQTDAPLQFRLGASFESTSNDFTAKETAARIKWTSSLDLGEPLEILFDASALLSQYEDITQQNRSLIAFRPALRYTRDALTVTAGLNAAIENDTLANADQMHIYPRMEAAYQVSEQVRLLANVDGAIEETTLSSLSRAMPWIEGQSVLAHENRKLSLGASLEAGLSTAVFFKAGLSYDTRSNARFFTNAASDSTRFAVLYDQGDMNQLTLFAGLNLQVSEAFESRMDLRYYNYTTDMLAAAWGRPDFQLNWLNTINLYNKIRIKPTLMLMGGIDMLNLQSGTEETLPLITDLSVQGDYLFSPRAAAWLKVDNIVGGNYERWLNYPVRGIQFGAGFSYKF